MELGTAAASAALAKTGAGGAAIGGAVVGGLTLSAAVVMMVKQPRSTREWGLALLSTLACSLGLGAALVLYLGLHKALASADQTEVVFGLLQVGGCIFASGLPGWVLVRIAFNTMAKYQDATATEVYQAGKDLLR